MASAGAKLTVARMAFSVANKAAPEATPTAASINSGLTR